MWHDQTWGDRRCNRLSPPLRREACAERGANHLGRLLEELRAQVAVDAQRRRIDTLVEEAS